MVSWIKLILLTLFTFVLAISIKSDFVFYLFGFEIMIILAAIIQVRLLARRLSFHIELDQTIVFRKSTFNVYGRLKNISVMPVPQLKARVAIRVYPDSELLLMEGKLMLNGNEEGRLCFEMDSEHCESIEIMPDQMIISDFLGIIQHKCKVDRDEKLIVHVLPEILSDDSNLMENYGSIISETGENDEKGNSYIDASEIREYQNGDSIKRIHWKLSARVHELLVREMSDPTEKLPWIFLDLQQDPSKPEVRHNPDLWDEFIEKVATVSATLQKMDKKHLVVWFDCEANVMITHQIFDETSLQRMLCALLRADSFDPRDYSQLKKEIVLDETKGKCIEINLQGDFADTEG